MSIMSCSIFPTIVASTNGQLTLHTLHSSILLCSGAARPLPTHLARSQYQWTIISSPRKSSQTANQNPSRVDAWFWASRPLSLPPALLELVAPPLVLNAHAFSYFGFVLGMVNGQWPIMNWGPSHFT
ncbi:hypothetical protein, variant [Exophiala mesophila]|uniref:Uncharacterized protein n=1 Tax=Exophiala mesophila TaxID=212818 RepID=A0A0D1ZL31_EXOME|nr:uncharacterized protein PV10_02391 [Exophiala mesophila]XP_016226218.1 hypothetical protein, variant [Exophiala mesophila]KIV94643.1 hypothetical protein PV10_02391 [Exophiala mesophila]KIV94644.1 hypothetical protein, variant [Exophiala mesophila]